MENAQILEQEISKTTRVFLAEKSQAVLGMRADALVQAIHNRINHDDQEAKRIVSEMAKLSDAYNRHLDLQNQLSAHERSSEKLKALLGPGPIPLGDQDSEAEELRSELQLWAVQQFLRFVPEARLREIVEFLGVTGIKTSRQAIEVGLRAHPKVFSVRVKKRVKFLSLKQRF
jgi:hypothetical protein